MCITKKLRFTRGDELGCFLGQAAVLKKQQRVKTKRKFWFWRVICLRGYASCHAVGFGYTYLLVQEIKTTGKETIREATDAAKEEFRRNLENRD